MNNLLKRWDLDSNDAGELIVGGCNALELGQLYETPMHVVNQERLTQTAESFIKAIKYGYPANASAHFAFKCNPVPGVIKIIKNAGLNAEVMSEPELMLALKLGYTGNEIIVNGPYKTDKLIIACIENNIRFINVDSVFELERINYLCNLLNRETEILLRINPDFIPSGMKKGSATGGRSGSPFGLDLKGGEVNKAIDKLLKMERIKFKGFHFHIGSGIQNTGDFRKVFSKLRNIVSDVEKAGFTVDVIDVGGGLGVPSSREMSTREMLLYQAFDYLESNKITANDLSFGSYIESVTSGVSDLFRNRKLPQLLFEPGRCIASSNQILLLKIHQVKERKGIKKWLISDAGISTLTMPTFYEHHEVVLCNDVNREPSERVTITGPGCFAADIVYRNKMMPEITPGEIIAIMDSGAYFTSWESSFGFPLPPIVSAYKGRHRILRARETFEDMFSLDTF